MNYLTVKQAKEFLKKYEIKNFNQWFNFTQSEEFPRDFIPKNPKIYYESNEYKKNNPSDSWNGLNNFLNIKFKIPTYKRFIEILNQYKIKNEEAYNNFVNLKLNPTRNDGYILPQNPKKHYRNSWTSWEVITGYHLKLELKKNDNNTELVTKFIRKKKDTNKKEVRNNSINKKKVFTTLRKFARSLKLKNQREWFQYYSQLINSDDPVYINDETFEIEYENLIYLKDFGIKNRLPILSQMGYANPARTFKGLGWKNWNDFLGTENLQRNQKIWSNFKDARDYARKLALKNRPEWELHHKKHKGKFSLNNKKLTIPLRPDRISFYNKEWVSWKDFLNISK